MKNLLIMLITLLSLSLTFTSCHKKGDEPTPSSTTTNPSNPSNPSSPKPLTFKDSTTSVSSGSGVQIIDIMNMVSYKGTDTVKITSITGASSNVVISILSDTTFSITPVNNIYAGVESLTINISDTKGVSTARTTSNTLTAILKVNVGTTQQITSYTLIAPYLNRSLTGVSGGLTLTTSTMLATTGNIQPNSGFYGSPNNSSSFILTTSGYLVLTSTNPEITYSIQVASGYLVLTNDNNANSIFQLQ
jgi:hypothetical protein